MKASQYRITDTIKNNNSQLLLGVTAHESTMGNKQSLEKLHSMKQTCNLKTSQHQIKPFIITFWLP